MNMSCDWMLRFLGKWLFDSMLHESGALGALFFLTFV